MNTVHIQSIGQAPAVKAEDLKVGMRRLYSFGLTGEVVALSPKGKQSLNLTTRSSDGELYTVTVRRCSLIAVA